MLTAQPSTPLYHLPLESRVRTFLEEQGIESLEDLLATPRSDLLCLRGCGKKSYRHILAVLELSGYELSDDPPSSLIIRHIDIRTNRWAARRVCRRPRTARMYW